MTKGIKPSFLVGIRGVGCNDEWLMEECLLNLPPRDLVIVPILVPISFVPLKPRDLAEINHSKP